jgi:tRNA G18 (ribose-2'-O)-methylase SpoU
MLPVIILENIRSAYNVGNIMRTADALGRGVLMTWYTPTPDSDFKVRKTSLWAELVIPRSYHETIDQAIQHLRTWWYLIRAGECTADSQAIDQLVSKTDNTKPIALIVGNEVIGVSHTALQLADQVTHIPMSGTKESLNVWQASAIMMREIKKKGKTT